MRTDKLEIILSYANGSEVDLDNMSIDALESFLSVTESLKNIAASVSPNITFTIKKGSACTVAYGTPTVMSNMFGEINKALEGESDNDVITSNLRDIQSHIKNQAYAYQFLSPTLNFGEKIKEAKTIRKKRNKIQYVKELRLLTGLFNNVGGNDPNYHFVYGSGNRTIVDCTRRQALDMRQYLYQTINCLVVKTFVVNDPEKTSYKHCEVLNHDQTQYFRAFIENLNKEAEILKRLDFIYEFVKNSTSRKEDLQVLLNSSAQIFDDPNEFKTLLILTKSLKDDPIIKSSRDKVLFAFDTYMNDL